MTVYSNDFVMVRVDKTLKEMMEEKPSSRWDAGYWDPLLTIADDTFKDIKYPVKGIVDFEEYITYGPIVVDRKFDHQKSGVAILNQTEIIFTGLDFSSQIFAKENSPWVIDRAKVRINDIVLARSGVGGVGKNKITIVNHKINACVGCFVDILRLKEINPYYVVVFWKGIFGWSQIQKIISGVGTVNINFDEIRSLKIPILPNSVQSHIETEYKKMSVYHDKAMDAKAKGNEEGFKENIEIAELMLKDLIAKTEAVIRGEREDVV
jgi:restriction endonuclease S subunit